MLEILERSEGRLVGLRVTGKITQDDVERASAHLEQDIQQTGGGIRLLVEVPQLAGIAPTALWDDLKFTLSHRRDFERVAIVADQRWLALWSRIAGALTPAETRHFSSAELEAAWRWLGESGSATAR